jgi:hypothetical protein
MNPTTSDPNVATNWRQSTAANGAPAADDRLLYAAWQAIHFPGGGPDALALADPEGDGIRNQVEFGLGTDPNAPTPASALPVAVPQLIQVGVDPAQWFLTFTYRRVKAAEELTWTAETSSDLVTWSASAADIVLVGTPVDHGDGTESRTYRATQPIAAEALRYFRAKVTKP